MEQNTKSLFKTAKHFKVKVTRKKENPIKFIISVLSYALFILLLSIGATLLVYVVDMKIKESRGEIPNPKFNAYVVLTGSMIPEIMVNDVVVTKRVEEEELKVGDIITFISSDSRFAGITVTHRIRQIFVDPTTGEYSFETKGDNNNTADFTHAKGSNVLGKVILKVPKLGYIQYFLATKGGWIFIILIPCLAVLSYDIMKLIKAIGKRSMAKKNTINIKN